MITAAATVAVYVEDTDASLEFWVDKVGFEVRVDRAMGSERWVEVGPPGAATASVRDTLGRRKNQPASGQG